MRSIILFVLLALPMLAFAQQQQNATCDQCQKTFALTKNSLWLVQNGTNQLCRTGFGNARGLAIDENGNIFVADEGIRGIWLVDSNCTSSTILVHNDDLNWSWFNPRDIAYDPNNSSLYVSMADIDPLWSTYVMPRRLLARERHVYRFKLSNGNITGDYDILAKGVDNGKDIDFIKWADGKVVGVRKNKYIVQLIEDVWVDYLGPQNDFQMEDNFVELRAVDSKFDQCGYLVASAVQDNQFMICTNSTSVRSCSARCSDKTLFSRAFGNIFNSSSNNSSSGDNSNSGNQIDFLPFFDPSCSANVQEDILSDSIGKNLSAALNLECDGLLLPDAVFIDCQCNLYVASRTSGAPTLLKYSISNSSSGASGSSSNGTTLALNLQSPVALGSFDLPVVKIEVFNISGASCNGQTQPTPEPTQATPQPTQATPEPTQATPQPTQATPEPTQATPQPTQATPQPTQETQQPTPQPTSTGQPTAAPSSIFQRLHRLV